MIIKTCGTTTLLAALPHVFTIAHKYCGYERPLICFYSRKAFLFPELQYEPHRSWKEEIGFMDMVFGKHNEQNEAMMLNKKRGVIRKARPSIHNGRHQ